MLVQSIDHFNLFRRFGCLVDEQQQTAQCRAVRVHCNVQQVQFHIVCRISISSLPDCWHLPNTENTVATAVATETTKTHAR